MAAAPSPPSAKRKAEDIAEDDGSKRLKPDIAESEELRQNGRPPRSPRISVNEEHLRMPVSEQQLMELLHYSALGKAPGELRRPSWCSLRRQRRLGPVCVAVVDHVTQRDFYDHFLSLPNLRTKYNTRVTLSSSSTNLVCEIFSSQVHVVHQTPQKKQTPNLHKGLKTHPVILKYGTERRGLTAYLLSAQEMGKHNYPLTGSPGCEEFVCTDSGPEVTDSSPLFGLDCEMCLTDQGSELTHVALVDTSGTRLLDQLVKPHNKIRNYLTQFSGVTKQMLRQVQTSLSEVQSRLRSLLPKDAVLVGHSLENDLRALKMIHPHVIDTSLLYRRHAGQRFKLKVLAETLLQKQIQTEDRTGHDPCEDAATALELAHYFISNGPLQVVEEHLEELWGITLIEAEVTPLTPAPSSRFADVLQACGRSVTFFGRRSDIGLSLCKQLWLSSDRQLLQAFRDQPKCPSFSVLHFSSGLTGGAHNRLRTQACPALRDLCVLFVGPLPPHSSEDDVRHLLCCCGPLLSVRIIRTVLRVHAQVLFTLPEGALLALSALDGLSVEGHYVQVQRPVTESTLDLDLTLEALQSDPMTHRLLYVSNICPRCRPVLHSTERTGDIWGHHWDIQGHNCRGILGHKHGDNLGHMHGDTHIHPNADTKRPTHGDMYRDIRGPPPLIQTPAHISRHTEQSVHRHTWDVDRMNAGLRENTLLDTFSRFGPVLRIITLSDKRRATHAYVEFVSADSRQAALRASSDLLRLNYLLCPALTPLHLSPLLSPAPIVPQEDTEAQEKPNGALAVAHRLRKLDRRLGKVFRCLPEGALSVVVLRGNVDSPGLCFVEIKKTS